MIVLLKVSPISMYNHDQVLGHHTNQSTSPSVPQFGQEASSKKNPGCFKLLPLSVTEIMLL